MKIVIRLDDISPGMDMGKFRRFKRLLDEYHIKPLIGVVPENLDPKLDSYRDEEETDKKPSKSKNDIADDKFSQMYVEHTFLCENIFFT